MKKVFTILGAVILLLGSILLDHTFQRFGKFQNLQSLQSPLIPFGTEIPVYIVLSILLLGLAWYVLYLNTRNYLIAFIYIMLGAVMLFFMSISGFFFLGSFLSGYPMLYLWFSDSVASIFAFTRNSAAMILIIGLLRLMPNKFLWRQKV